MAQKRIVLVLNGGQEYIKHTEDEQVKYAAQANILFEAISETYIPLLKLLEKLETSEKPVKLSLVLSPILCTLLDDAQVQDQYISWLDNRIALGQSELERCKSNPKLLENAKSCLQNAEQEKEYYLAINKKILKKFHEYQKKGLVELLATCGTDIYLPHYNDMPEIMGAQVETGIYAYRNYFGEIPEGFWLPELGYYPGIEKIVKAYGMNYTILDARSFLFSEKEPLKGIFYPARFDNALVAFAKDPYSDQEIFGEDGFVSNNVYKAQNRDIGYELDSDKLTPYIQKGFPRYGFEYKYWKKGSIRTESENIYDSNAAFEQCKKDASAFVECRMNKLSQAEELLPESDYVCLTVCVNLDTLRANWAEGIQWIEQVINNICDSEAEMVLPKSMTENPFALQRIKPYYGSSSGQGYGEDLISNKNNWMMRYVRKASERMVDLANRFPSDTGLKARLLNLGAKELMLAQSCGWAKMIENSVFPDYAETRFKQSIIDFTAVFDALGSNTVSTEWLTNLELEHQVFPWMNYRIFSKKI